MYIQEISVEKYSETLKNYILRTPFHEVSWLKNVEVVYKIKIKYLGLYNQDENIAILPVFIKKIGLINLYGLPLAQAATPSINPLIKTGYEVSFLKSLDEWVKKKKIKFFQLSWKYTDCPDIKNIEIEKRDNLEVDLTPILEDVFKNFKSEARSRVRKAVRSGVKVHWARGHWVLAEYEELLNSTYMRQNLTPNFPIPFYSGLYMTMANKNLKIIYSTYKSNVIAMLWILYDNQKCYFWDGASNQEFRKLSANHLLHWEIARWAKKRNIRVYDMIGRSAKSGRSGARPGIGRFKRSLGAKAIDYYVIYWKSPSISYLFKLYRQFLRIKNNPEYN